LGFFAGCVSQPPSILKTYQTPQGTILLGIDFPKSPESVTLYRVVPHDQDMVTVQSNHAVKIRQGVISEADAPAAALGILAKYGGIPDDAVFNRAETSYAVRFDTTNTQVIAKYPISTSVQYNRMLSGMPVEGGGYIVIDLGENGELIELRKIWRTVQPSGTVKIIPASAAFDKLLKGEYIGNRLKCNCENLNITRIQLGYYEKGDNETQEYLDPIWIFRGTLPDNNNWSFNINAKKFDNVTPLQTFDNNLMNISNLPNL